MYNKHKPKPNPKLNPIICSACTCMQCEKIPSSMCVEKGRLHFFCITTIMMMLKKEEANQKKGM